MEGALQPKPQDSLAAEGVAELHQASDPADVDSNGSVMLRKTTESSASGQEQNRFSGFQWVSKKCKGAYDKMFRQEAPKKLGAVVTLQDLLKSVPPISTARMKLKNPAEAKEPREPPLMLEVKGCVEGVDGMLRKAEDPHLEQKPAKEALQRNQERVRAIFDGFEQEFRQMAGEVAIKYSSLTLEQQEEFLVIWKAANEIIGIVLDWLSQVFDIVLEKIQDGCVIEKDVLKGIFKMGAAKLTDLFFEPMKKFIE